MHPTESQELKTGDNYTLRCAVSAGEIRHWLFDSNRIAKNNTAYSINGGELTITSFESSLAGRYRCVASRDGGITHQVSHAGSITYFGERKLFLPICYLYVRDNDSRSLLNERCI